MSRARCIPRRRKAAGGAWRGRRHGEVRRGGVRRAACGDHHALQRHPPPPLRRLQCGRAWCGARARLSPRQRSGGAGPMVRGGTARAKASASATRTRGCAVTCCRRGAHVPRRAARGRLRHSAAAAGGERTAPAPTCDASASMRLPLLPLLVLPLVLRPAAAGICWSGMERGGRCSSVAALRVGRAECCAGAARAPAAWSPRDLDSGQIFFYKALSGGVPCSACDESCSGVRCGAGRRCAVRGGRARCVCAAACRRAGPVCGTDGRTYRSLCRLRRRACRRPAKHLALDYPGPCQVGTCEGVRCGGDKRCVLDAELGAHCARCGACSTAGAPVCAVDGRTYAGACALRRAACERGRALPLAYRGSCIANATCTTIRCGSGQRCNRNITDNSVTNERHGGDMDAV
ncbi:PREDICTED: follistatin-A [Papilio polytes]|uniref:follistatin-A n=1 Tax=Papilio polytes TaxID=76194 RepID=UPI00067649D5|nr:PREDICTED: follistatin-A [Papilio polytes]